MVRVHFIVLGEHVSFVVGVFVGEFCDGGLDGGLWGEFEGYVFFAVEDQVEASPEIYVYFNGVVHD